MTLNGFGIRAKLNLLLALPLAAVMFVAVPFFVDRLGNASSAATTATVALNARQLGTLVSQLQRERLITAGYLASADADGVDLLIQQQAVIDLTATVRANLDADVSDEIVGALTRVGSLKDLRQNVLRRRVAVDSVVRTYQAIIDSVINSLRLTAQRGTDAEGARQLAALDALLRASEQSTLRAMALVAAATTPQTGLRLLDSSSEQFHLFSERFGQQASRSQSALVVLVDQGETARRLDELIKDVPEVLSADSDRTAFLSEVLTVAEIQASLRRMVLDRVTTEIADAAAARAAVAEGAAWTVGLGTAALFTVVIGIALLVSRSIADPLRQLTMAAAATADLANAELTRVADVEGVDERPPRLATIDIASGHEVGALAAAFNRVQATAAMLLERQVVSRRNVSLMFANVAQRTQNLVTRQLHLVDKLERDEQNVQILAGLYQIDHISTRLRRTSENLLVIAGARDNAKLGGPATLAAVVRSALAEIEEYRRVRFDEACEVLVAPALVSDLVLVFAELLENATSFSPPQSSVEVQAVQQLDRSCVVRIIDHGIGMAPEPLIEENRRLVERERLDVAPTRALGLFVVGRLARRHGLQVALTATPLGGLTATVRISAAMTIGGAAPTESKAGYRLAPAPARQSAPALLQLPEHPSAPVDSPGGGFAWFTAESGRQIGGASLRAPVATPTAGPTPPVPALPDGESRQGFNRRVAGAQLPAATAALADNPPPARPTLSQRPRDAGSVRTALDEYQAAVGKPTGVDAPAWPTQQSAGSEMTSRVLPAGLSRRVPGANLAPGLKDKHVGAAAHAGDRTSSRDAEASRAAFDGYVRGLSRAAEHTSGETSEFPVDEGE